MKNISLFLILFLSAWGGSYTMNAQQIIKKSGWYYLVEDSVSVRISSKDVKTMLLTRPQSKRLYENSKKQGKIAWISLGASVPFFLIQAGKNFNPGLHGSSSTDFGNENNTMAFIGISFVGISVIAGVTSWCTFRKSIDAYNNVSDYRKAEEHTLHINAGPGGVNVAYRF